jgi:hypothetical protein
MLCISLYRIGNGGNKLFVFVFVFVICRDRRERERTPTGYYGAKDFYERYVGNIHVS